MKIHARVPRCVLSSWQIGCPPHDAVRPAKIYAVIRPIRASYPTYEVRSPRLLRTARPLALAQQAGVFDKPQKAAPLKQDLQVVKVVPGILLVFKIHPVPDSIPAVVDVNSHGLWVYSGPAGTARPPWEIGSSAICG